VKIGVVGIGKMGGAIATRLLGLGHEVVVWNRSAEKAKAVSGAKVAATPRELAGDVETIISILTNAAAIDAAYEGADGLLKGDIQGKLFIEMSTVRPQTEKQLAAKARALGAAFIDCPVGGTVGPAREGKLLGFVGGDADDVARARPLLEQMCRRVEHVGPIGAGARFKLAINLPLLVYWQALGEALSLVRDLQIEPNRLMDILADTSGAPNMLKNRAATLAGALAGKEPSPVTVNVDTMKKDLTEMVEEMRSLGWPSLVAQAALNGFAHASKAGLGAKDCSMLPVSWSSKPQKL